MKVEQPQRGTQGVVCSLVVLPGGAVRLVMDDAQSGDSSFPQEWKVIGFFTHSEYDGSRFMQTEFSEAQLADIGLSIVARLAAWLNPPEPDEEG